MSLHFSFNTILFMILITTSVVLFGLLTLPHFLRRWIAPLVYTGRSVVFVFALIAFSASIFAYSEMNHFAEKKAITYDAAGAGLSKANLMRAQRNLYLSMSTFLANIILLRVAKFLNDIDTLKRENSALKKRSN